MDNINERALQALVESLDKEVEELYQKIDKEQTIRDCFFDCLVAEIGPNKVYKIICDNDLPLKKFMEETYSANQLGGILKTEKKSPATT